MLDLSHRIIISGDDKGPPYFFLHSHWCADYRTLAFYGKSEFSEPFQKIAEKYNLELLWRDLSVCLEGLVYSVQDLKRLALEIFPFKASQGEVDGPLISVVEITDNFTEMHHGAKTLAKVTLTDYSKSLSRDELRVLQSERVDGILSDSVRRLVC